MQDEDFSVAIIARNEEKVLPRLLDSLKGISDVCVVSTGSTDRTVEIAKEYGCNVVEVGDRFKVETVEKDVGDFRKLFGFWPSFKAGESYFHFSNARNYALTLTKHDFVFQPDADEVVEWDLNKVKEFIKDKDQLVYRFVYAHKPDGSPGLEFTHCKFFRKSKVKWTGFIHEIHTPVEGENPQPPAYTDLIYHHHWQEHKEERGNYLPGLELSMLEDPDNDRNLFYLAREYFYKGMWEISIKMFNIALKKMWWQPERGQAYIFMAQCYEHLNEDLEALRCLFASLRACDTRREPFFELGEYYSKRGNLDQAVSYYLAALGVPYRPHGYLNSMELYGWMIHDRLATTYSQIGAKDLAKEQWLKCLQFDDVDKRILSNVSHFYEIPKISIVVPTCRPEGFQRLKRSIEEHTIYPDWEVIEMPGEGTAVEKFNAGVKRATGDLIVFMADDTEATLGWLTRAFVCLQERLNGRGAVIFNDGHWNGTLANHYMISKDLKDDLGGELWHSGYKHNGVDVEMFCRLTAKKQIVYDETAKIIHHHYYSATKGAEKDKRDEWSDKVLEWALKDRRLLIKRLHDLGLEKDALRYEEWFRGYYPGISLTE